MIVACSDVVNYPRRRIFIQPIMSRMKQPSRASSFVADFPSSSSSSQQEDVSSHSSSVSVSSSSDVDADMIADADADAIMLPPLVQISPVLSSPTDASSQQSTPSTKMSFSEDKSTMNRGTTTTTTQQQQQPQPQQISSSTMRASLLLSHCGGSGGGVGIASKDWILHSPLPQPPQPAVHDGHDDLFAVDVRSFLRSNNELLQNLDSDVSSFVSTPAFRKMMEPHLRKSRIARERSRSFNHSNSHRSASSTSTNASTTTTSHNHHHLSLSLNSMSMSMNDYVGVPYSALRTERAFLFDEHSFPLHTLLAEALHVPDLSRLHHDRKLPSDQIVANFLMSGKDHDSCLSSFHRAYDSFVTSFCIPLLHSFAMTYNLLNQNSSSSNHNSGSDYHQSMVTYRYQAFPSIRIVQPGDPARSPMCDTALGHSMGCLHFCIPLTPTPPYDEASTSTTATTYHNNNNNNNNGRMFVESHPGREDWHPLASSRAFGLGHVFDGARCMYFDLGGGENIINNKNNISNASDMTTTHVALHFRVLLYRDECGPHHHLHHHHHHDIEGGGDDLCPKHLIEDSFSRRDPNYYEEVVVDVEQRSSRRCISNRSGFDQDNNNFVMKKHRGDDRERNALRPISFLMTSFP